METGVDNTNINNTASNNAFDLFDVFQKRGLDHFATEQSEFNKSNGTAESKKSDMYLFDRPANGKRRADDEFDEEDEDFGPETDVDGVDDVLLSPMIASAKAMEKVLEGNGNNNDNQEKMDTLDVDLELQRQQSSEFEPVREPREETPTPPADSVLDSSGLADNVAESEDSEDEWNYYRVDPKQKENNVPPLETNNKVTPGTPPHDDMSQLNPDAKEFVPVSPTRTAVSPAPHSRDLLDDALIAQSPRRALPMDISVPSAREFQREVKQRPSELFDDEFEAENTQNQNGHQLSSQEIMQNLLNGKDVSEIEFHPSNYFGNNLICENQNETENSKENIKSSEEQPTESSISQITDVPDFSTFVPKPQDPMSMSFYQDKDDEVGFSTNPFDLNKVQLLPENVDEFIQPTSEVETEKSSSPAQSPLGVPLSPAKSPFSLIQSEQEVPSQEESVKSPEPSEASDAPVPNDALSPVECMMSESPLLEISRSPLPESKSPLLEESKSPVPEVCELPSKTPELCEMPSKTPELCELSSKTPEVCELPSKSPLLEVESARSPFEVEESKSLLEIANSPVCGISESPVCEIAKSPVCEISQSPVCEIAKSPLLETAKSPEISQSPVCEIAKSPVCEISQSPVCDIAKSPVCEISQSPVCEIAKSPAKSSEISQSPLCELSKSPIPPIREVSKSPFDISKSPILDVHSPMELSSPVGPLSPKSPIPELTGLVSPDITASIKDENISGEISETPKSPVMDDVLKSPIQELVNEVAKSPFVETTAETILSPVAKSPFEVEAAKSAFEAATVEQTLSELVEQSTDLFNQVSDDIQMKIDDAVCEINKEETKVQELISDAIQDFDIAQKEPELIIEAKSPILEVCELKKQVEEQITEIVKEAEVTSEAQEVVKDVLQTVSNEFNNLIDGSTQKEAENVFVPPSEIINSFLERSTVPEVTSPLSPVDEPEKFQTDRPESWKENLEIKCETIKPEFAIHTMTSPSEESKGTDTPPPTPAIVIEEPQLKRGSPEPEKLVEAVEKLETVIPTEVKAKVAAKPAPKSATTTTKKPLASKTSPISPSKPLPSKTTTSTAKKAPVPTKSTLAPKPPTPRAAAKPSTPTASPRSTTTTRTTAKATTPTTTTTRTTPKPAEKKPLTNGDVKPASRTLLMKKTTTSTTTTASKTSGATTAAKMSPTKPAARPSSVTMSKSAAPRNTTAPKPPAAGTVPKPRPASLKTSTTTTSATTTKTATSRPATTGTARPAAATTARPKTTTTTLAARPRSTATAARPATKAPDTEKQIKETANKQLSAARTATNRTNTAAAAAKTTTAATRKVDAKTTLSSRTTTTRTTTLKSTTKKPTEVTRTTITKTKTAVAKPAAEQNGIVNVIQEITTTIVSDDPQLLKDNSPVENIEIDNSKIAEVIAD